jgi:hypothetical protein
MSAGQYMGNGDVQALIGAWQQLIGANVSQRGQYGRVGAEITAMSPARRGGYGYAEPYRHHHHRHHREYNPYEQWGGWGGYPQQAYVQGLPQQQIIGNVPMGGIDGFPPRNLLIDAPAPQRAGREVLPMSVDTPILIGQSAQITSRPQRVAFRPERVFISAGPTGEGANAWLVNDIKIGNRSQFSQSGYIPGDMFANVSIDSFVSFETAQTAMDIVMVVTYNGASSDGQPFFGAIIGTAAV